MRDVAASALSPERRRMATPPAWGTTGVATAAMVSESMDADGGDGDDADADADARWRTREEEEEEEARCWGRGAAARGAGVAALDARAAISRRRPRRG